MTKCPYCFQSLPEREILFRCTSGECDLEVHQSATAARGYPVETSPVVAAQVQADGKLPTSFMCMQCFADTEQEVCPHCFYDVPTSWRGATVFTVTVIGARGSGKSVYIAVMIEVLKRYLDRARRQLSPLNTRTRNLYSSKFFDPLYKENQVLPGTPEVLQLDAPQRDSLIWRASGGVDGKEFFLVLRDTAGEDFERATERRGALTYLPYSDLILFMFDPMVLPTVTGLLQGIIPNVDARRLGGKAGDVFPNLVTHMEGKGGLLAVMVSKFDSLQQLAEADNSYSIAMGDPAALFNRDETMLRSVGPYDRKQHSNRKKDFRNEVDFLDAEVRSLLAMLNETTITNQADQAVKEQRFQDVRHFAVSALGETPQHENKLTERGISPFRVLDPILWGLEQRDIVI